MAGRVGVALGVIVGHQYDRATGDPYAEPFSGASAAEIGEHFFRAAFRVMGHIAKADGRVSEQEIAAARGIMAELRLDPLRVRTAIDCFGEGKQPSFDLTSELAGLRRLCSG